MTPAPSERRGQRLANEILALQIEIRNDRDRNEARRKFFKRLQDEGRQDEANDLLTYEAVLGERVNDKPTFEIHGPVANLNTGIQTAPVIATINGFADRSENQRQLADALRQILASIEGDPELETATKQEAVDAVGALSEQATLEPAKRKSFSFKSALTFLQSTMATTAAGIKIWEAWGPVIKGFFS